MPRRAPTTSWCLMNGGKTGRRSAAADAGRNTPTQYKNSDCDFYDRCREMGRSHNKCARPHMDRLSQKVHRGVAIEMTRRGDHEIVQHHDRHYRCVRAEVVRGGVSFGRLRQLEEPAIIPGAVAPDRSGANTAHRVAIGRQLAGLPARYRALRHLGQARHLGLRKAKYRLADVDERVHAGSICVDALCVKASKVKHAWRLHA